MSNAERRADHFMDVVARIRQIYSGLLTYQDVALWYNGTDLSNFWGALDFIGVPFYFPASDNNPNPSVEEMVAYIIPQARRNLLLTIDRYHPPVIAIEMSRPNFDGTNYDCWNWTPNVDSQEQVNYDEAAFQVQLTSIADFRGGFIWKFWPRLRSQVYPIDWDFRNKPLEKALGLWYSD